MASVSEVTRTRSVYFVDSAGREAVGGTALIEREEAEELTDGDELRDLIRERTEEPA
jgi:putative transcriptional regulator